LVGFLFGLLACLFSFSPSDCSDWSVEVNTFGEANRDAISLATFVINQLLSDRRSARCSQQNNPPAPAPIPIAGIGPAAPPGDVRAAVVSPK